MFLAQSFMLLPRLPSGQYALSSSVRLLPGLHSFLFSAHFQLGHRTGRESGHLPAIGGHRILERMGTHLPKAKQYFSPLSHFPRSGLDVL